MGVMVIACYRPKPGEAAALHALVKTHTPRLQALGLVGETPSLAGVAADGTVVEVFVWKSQEAIDQAHDNPAVQQMWGEFAAVCDFTTIREVAGAGDLFTPLTPLG